MILDASKQVWVLDCQVPHKIILVGIKVLVAKVPIVCAALDYQGGDSGQITSGGWGGGEMFERVLLALQEQKTCSQVSGFICLQVFCSKKGGQ